MIASTLAALMLLQEAPAPAVPAAPPVPACAAEQYQAFDFWVGEWNVSANGSDQQVATSVIRKLANGCAIHETWMPLQGGGGTSVSTRDPNSGTWHQLWVGSVPGRVFFEGGPVEGNMVLTGYWGTDNNGVAQLIRMTYTAQEDGTVRQYGEVSTDHGANWSDSFDFIYSRQAG
ncbi:hypothetical protein [Aurantiacibacter marinus]|uniref:DUF1579 domain-containing protein n=1 Tax=Aurantiacibacter marinus TaxID=874156 RepID=A0A0H0XJQ3_9SPHN|nr:hypothetical protein [Aurantiacibacter marinus]KLI62793.1 hypothetical protein AAV99_13315 [Aurantiacibacter marinus]